MFGGWSGARVLLAGEGRAWIWLAAGAVALALLIALYRAERKLVSRRAGLALLGLRTLAAGVLVLALFEPIAARSRTETLRGRVVVAADVSESMDTVDPGGSSRRDRARSLVEGDSAPLAKLNADHDVKALAFAREAGPEGALAALADRLKDRTTRDAVGEKVSRGEKVSGTVSAAETVPDTFSPTTFSPADASATDWTGALSAALKAPDDTPALGVILLTDGRKNGGDDAPLADRLAARGVPVYSILIGSTIPPKDVAIASLKAPESVYKGDVAAIEATIKADGVEPGASLTVTLNRPGAPPMTQSVAIDREGSRPVATFRVPLESPGMVPLTVSVAPPPGFTDARPDNDSRAASVLVADDKASVLLVDGESRWEFRYLRDALSRDPRVALDAVVLHPPPTVGTAEATYPSTLPARPGVPTEADPLNRFDAIVVGDADLAADVWARLETYAGERGGTLVIAAGPGRWPAESGKSDATRALLPVTDLHRLDPDPSDDPAHPSLPPGAVVGPVASALDDASTWPMLRLGADVEASRAAWLGLPRLPWSLAGRPKPGASALVAPGKDDDSAVIAAMPYGLGKVLWVGTDGTWRWRYRSGDAIHHRFWGQVVRWASSGKLGAGNTLVRFGPSSPRARSGQPIAIQARIAEGVPDVGPDFLIAARIVRSGAKPGEASAVVPLRAVPGRPRLFEGSAPGLPEGSYTITLDAPSLANSGPIGDAPLTVAPRETSERIELSASRDALDRLAALTGGKVVTPESAGEIPGLLKARLKTTTRVEETPLWDSPVALVLFLGIVGAEWVVRKRVGLP